MESFVEEYIIEWNRRNPNAPFANLVKGEVTTDGRVYLYLPIFVGGVLHKENLMEPLTRGVSFVSVENALKNFFDKYPKFSDFDFATREVKPGAPIAYMAPRNDTPITFEEVLRNADRNGIKIPSNYILVDKKPDILPNTPPPTTTTTKSKIGIGWILLGIAVGGIVLYKIAKK